MTDKPKNRLFNRKTRREVATEYMNSPRLFQELAFRVHEDIIEAKRDWTSIQTELPGHEFAVMGVMPYDEELLKRVEGKLKAAFSEVNHLRFAPSRNIVIDTKPNNRWRRWRASPGCSNGAG